MATGESSRFANETKAERAERLRRSSENFKKWYAIPENCEKAKARQRELRKIPEERRKMIERGRKYQKTEKSIRSRKRFEAKLRLEALAAYSKGEMRCQCECGCTEDREVYLELDHVNNDGADHRRAICGTKQASSTWVRALKRLGWPNDPPIRTLCCKCNVGRQRNCGQCPELGIFPPEERFSATNLRKKVAR